MDWKGWQVACIASGPSLTGDDCELVRAWRGPGRAVLAVNTSFRAAPWADALFALDRAWWNVYGAEVKRLFHGRCYSGVCTSHAERVIVGGPRNSGGLAMVLAATFGARRLILLGYDAQLTDGRAHWHGNHEGGLGNCGTVKRWPGYFQEIKGKLGPQVEVVNASRETAITCFPRCSLDEALRAEAVAA